MSEDWDDGPSDTAVAPTPFTGGFGGAKSSSFGTANGAPSFGRGRGYVPSAQDTTVPRSGGRGSAFGSKSSALGEWVPVVSSGSEVTSFGQSSGGNDSSGWNETEDEESAPRGGGFGRNKTFGSNGGGFSGGGGFGRSSKGGSACFKCGEEGHMSRECPQSGGGGGGGRACYKCGEEGHMSRECPSAGGGGGGGGSRACYKCGEEGHMSRECPSGGGGGGGGGGSRACYKCGEEGHMSRECPSGGGGGGGGGGGSRACYKCGEEGHMSRECPNAGSGGGGGGGSRACYKCGEEGHMSRECPSAGGSSSSKACFKCKEEGHMSKDCPTGGGNACFKCGEEGHMSRDCTSTAPQLDKDGKPREAPYVPPEVADGDLFEGITTGINFNNYDDIEVSVSGINVPKPISRFEETTLRDLLKLNIKKANYEKPTPVQKYSIPIILSGRDLMACAQTGSGKTAAFLVPILNGLLDGDVPSASFKDVQEPLAVILAPTRELAIQIHNEARKFAHGTILKSVVIYGGTSVGYQSRQLQAGCHVLVATPGRLMDFVEKGKVAFGQLRYFVLDEADRMLDMGFMPSVREVVNHNTTPPKSERHTLMFSATFPEEIQKLAAEFLEDYLFLAVGLVGAANRDVLQSFYQIEKFSKRDKLIEVLSEAIEKKEKVLVFVDTKRTADFVASLMSQKGFPTTSIHGDRLQREREEALSDFRSGTMPVLVATAVAARGLDIKDVSYVVNYDLPKSIEEYVHRIGRTGRVGNLGKATSFYDSGEDQPLAKALIKILQDAHQEVPDWLVAEGSGMGGYTQSYSRGKFGARDIRGMKDSGGDDWENSSAGGFGTGISSAAGNIGCDESWD